MMKSPNPGLLEPAAQGSQPPLVLVEELQIGVVIPGDHAAVPDGAEQRAPAGPEIEMVPVGDAGEDIQQLVDLSDDGRIRAREDGVSRRGVGAGLTGLAHRGPPSAAAAAPRRQSAEQ